MSEARGHPGLSPTSTESSRVVAYCRVEIPNPSAYVVFSEESRLEQLPKVTDASISEVETIRAYLVMLRLVSCDYNVEELT
jgi:hypothetical protein